ncbi:hypothetical protein WR25_21263 isoform C [Diploscapter pachys]|uniref:CUB domain-containing protein n=1 Tax=Diploscapter pachys TaxID=2018661 RepID=A0A2A2JD93_9BILA|nr:hypothetical protein WR25_21263 isoform A [Diploscapter pachys]PAV59673.1 hypothetical protein WR25_21263 isoform B [Diploscapter pachys]PAV59674.1 hypothetical protein WR25_21263 isoform C [Diploscapter pachys]
MNLISTIIFSVCDYVFDKSSEGTFSLPLLPPSLPKSPTIEEAFNQSTNATFPSNIQCIYTFVAGPGQRVKLEFDEFSLAGSSENCQIEYVDIYSELKSPDFNVLSSALAGRYCGSIAPQIRISLYNILVIVFHSRSHTQKRRFLFRGRYSFISDAKYRIGRPIDSQPCSFIVDSSIKERGELYSPTYPGSYPQSFFCSYLLRGRKGQRIHVQFPDFDVFFGGEHCPYDSVTIFDGPTSSYPIIKKLCGLQQKVELYSFGHELLIHFNTTRPAKTDPRGFVMEYKFTSDFVNLIDLLDGQEGVTHIRGTECDLRVQSNRETTHYIKSPNYPNAYPVNTTCTYVIDGLQGEQHLEKAILKFESIAVINSEGIESTAPSSPDDITCPSAWVGVAITESNMRAVMSSTDESVFDYTLCERIPANSPLLGPYISEGPRMTVQFGSTNVPSDNLSPLGFKAQIDFKTDFGIDGEELGHSNECMFRFTGSAGFFNSPRYPANYPLDANCTYLIVGQPKQEILIYFEQFALANEENKKCADWVKIYDVYRDSNGKENLVLQHRYCGGSFPGPVVSSFGVHEMRVIFNSDSDEAANGFKAFYLIRKSRAEDVPTKFDDKSSSTRCGGVIDASIVGVTGSITSPNFPVKYAKNEQCYWLIKARENHKILLRVNEMEIEGEMKPSGIQCQNAVIRVNGEEYCGTELHPILPILSNNNTLRISFITNPEKVNGLQGFNFTWTEVKVVEEQHCSTEDLYLCTYSKLCISSTLRCNGDVNCGYGVVDDTDEQHCERKENSADMTVLIAGMVCALMFTALVLFFCFVFKKKLERKKKSKRHSESARRQREPYRQQKPLHRAHAGEYVKLHFP